MANFSRENKENNDLRTRNCSDAVLRGHNLNNVDVCTSGGNSFIAEQCCNGRSSSHINNTEDGLVELEGDNGSRSLSRGSIAKLPRRHSSFRLAHEQQDDESRSQHRSFQTISTTTPQNHLLLSTFERPIARTGDDSQTVQRNTSARIAPNHCEVVTSPVNDQIAQVSASASRTLPTQNYASFPQNGLSESNSISSAQLSEVDVVEFGVGDMSMAESDSLVHNVISRDDHIGIPPPYSRYPHTEARQHNYGIADENVTESELEQTLNAYIRESALSRASSAEHSGQLNGLDYVNAAPTDTDNEKYEKLNLWQRFLQTKICGHSLLLWVVTALILLIAITTSITVGVLVKNSSKGEDVEDENLVTQ